MKEKAKRNTTSSHEHYKRGSKLETKDVSAARAAYEACLGVTAPTSKRRINLGRLLHAEGLLAEAEGIYRGADGPSAVLYFNLGVLLEDLQRQMEAIKAYREAILHDPGMADAHFNRSLIHERLGEPQNAFRHLPRYRRSANIRQGGPTFGVFII